MYKDNTSPLQIQLHPSCAFDVIWSQSLWWVGWIITIWTYRTILLTFINCCLCLNACLLTQTIEGVLSLLSSHLLLLTLTHTTTRPTWTLPHSPTQRQTVNQSERKWKLWVLREAINVMEAVHRFCWRTVGTKNVNKGFPLCWFNKRWPADIRPSPISDLPPSPTCFCIADKNLVNHVNHRCQIYLAKLNFIWFRSMSHLITWRKHGLWSIPHPGVFKMI